jgi:sugar/nucleoside kinase (ribokinase family)
MVDPKDKFVITTTDLLLIDLVFELADAPWLQELFNEKGLEEGNKGKIDTLEKYEEYVAGSSNTPHRSFVGGSAYNTSSTISRLLGDMVEVNFIGAAQEEEAKALMLRRAFRDANINLIPGDLPPESGVTPQPAISYVGRYESGERAIATWPANAAKVTTPELIDRALIERSDAVFLQASIGRKLDPAVRDTLLKYRSEAKEGNGINEIDFWLAAPTSKAFGIDQAEFMQYLSSSANVVLSNEQEIAMMMGTAPIVINSKGEPEAGEANQEQIDAALKEMQRIFREDTVLDEPPVGYISHGVKGAYIVTADEITHVPVPEKLVVNKDEIGSTLGAGDNFFAGVLAARIINKVAERAGEKPPLSHEQAVLIGMAISSAKVRHNSATIEDPAGALRELLPQLGGIISPPEKDHPRLQRKELPEGMGIPPKPTGQNGINGG